MNWVPVLWGLIRKSVLGGKHFCFRRYKGSVLHKDITVEQCNIGSSYFSSYANLQNSQPVLIQNFVNCVNVVILMQNEILNNQIKLA